MDEAIKKVMVDRWSDGRGYSGIEKAYELTKVYAGTAGANSDVIPYLFIKLADLFVLHKDPRDDPM